MITDPTKWRKAEITRDIGDEFSFRIWKQGERVLVFDEICGGGYYARLETEGPTESAIIGPGDFRFL